MPDFRTTLFTTVTMAAFAANSVLCRLALADDTIDPASFAGIRLASGAIALAILVLARRPSPAALGHGSWRSAAALAAYAAGFAYAYVSLPTGTGALLLFGAVQLVMIGAGLLAGERPGVAVWLGLVVAVVGLAALVAPGVDAPEPVGTVLMLVAGASWGVYSLRGRGSDAPLAMTTGNFVRSVPIAVALGFVGAAVGHVTGRGIALAVVSGAVTSGLGYALWYAALRGHTATSAGIVQLSVPALAALGGVAFLGEPLTARLLGAGTVTVGGVALAILGRTRTVYPSSRSAADAPTPTPQPSNPQES